MMSRGRGIAVFFMFACVLPAQANAPADGIDCAPTTAASVGDDWHDWRAAAKEFDACLAAAAEAMTEEERSEALAGEGTSMRHKLMAIAVHREKEPELYKRIRLYYSDDGVSRSPMPPDFRRDKHALETYRLVWEYFLLRPHSDLRTHATQALGEIGNPISVVTMRHVYGFADASERHAILVGLAGIPCQESAGAVAEIVEKSGDQGDPDSEAPWKWRPRTTLVNRMSGLSDPKLSAWLALLSDVGTRSPKVQRLARGVRARLMLNRALKASYQIPERMEAEPGDSGVARDRMVQVVDEFDSAMAAAGGLLAGDEGVAELNPNWRPGRFMARFAEIAIDSAHRPRVYQELLRTYVQMRGSATIAPPLMKKHTTAAYRLAWEWILLRPRPSDGATAYENRAAEAIGAISDQDSLVALEHAIDVTTKNGVSLTDRVAAAQRSLLDALLEMPSETAGETISLVLSDIKRHRWIRSDHDERVPDWDATIYAVEKIVRMPAKKRDSWLAVTDEDWPARRATLRDRLKQQPLHRVKPSSPTSRYAP